MKTRATSLLQFAILSVCIVGAAWGQQVTAAFTGRVTDQSGGAVVSAKVTVTDVDRGTQWNTVTNRVRISSTATNTPILNAPNTGVSRTPGLLNASNPLSGREVQFALKYNF